MPTVRLIHWNAAEAKERAKRLVAAGYRVNARPFDGTGLRELRRKPPAAVVIDLGRLPAQGRDVGIAVRSLKATRGVPLVFVDGDPTKVANAKKHLPDAVYTTWSRVAHALRRAIAHPPNEPVKPPSVMAAYAGAPLVKKLGIGADSTLVLIGAPPGFQRTLGTLPANVRVRRDNRGRRDLTLWFVKTELELERGMERVARAVAEGHLWIVWPKKTSRVSSDLTPARIRRIAEASGLVDFKIGKIDVTWSGLKFARKKKR